ncbi:MAG: hypothetical protein WCJ01_06925 [Ignavibacteria bacterium]
MKKLLLLLLPFIFGCDNVPTNTVDQPQNTFQLTKLNAPQSFKYLKADSSFVTSVKLNSSLGVKEVWADVYDNNNIRLDNSSGALLDNGNIPVSGDSVKGDNVYSFRVRLSKYYTSGNYRTEYYLRDNNDNVYVLAFHSFSYINDVPNQSPVISNLIAPDSLDISLSGAFVFELSVADADGVNDIKSVYFKSYRPDGTTTDVKFDMYDDGRVSSDGDRIAGDGIFSYKTSLPNNVQKGDWTFVFRAVDKSDSTSNIISHKIYVKLN